MDSSDNHVIIDLLMKVVSIEKAGDEAWAGVAAIDRGEETISIR
jgi:hypothetical protein